MVKRKNGTIDITCSHDKYSYNYTTGEIKAITDGAPVLSAVDAASMIRAVNRRYPNLKKASIISPDKRVS